jgi:hypothetical protein
MGLVQHGLIDEVETAVATVQNAGGDVWIAAIESLQHLLRHEKNVPEEILARVRRLLGTLQPDDLRNQLKLAVTEAPWDLLDENERDEKIPLVERLGRRATALGEAVARNIDTLIPLIPELIRGEQRQAWVFGSSLIRKVDDKPRIFDEVIFALRGVPSTTRNLSLIGGMVYGVRDTEPALADTVISRFASDAELVWGVPYLTVAAGVTPARLPLVVELAREKRIPAWHFSHFAAGRALYELSPGEVAPLLLSLLRSGGDYWGVALDLIGMFSFQRRGVLNDLMPVLESVFDTLTWEEMPKGRSSMVLHHFKEITEWLLDKGESERIAIKTAIKLAELVRDGSDDGDFQREDALAIIVPVLLRDFGTAVWPILSEGALGADLRAFKLRQLLGDRPCFNEDEMPPILELPETLLMSWCHAHPERAPAFLARTLPVLEAKASAINRPRTWHPLTRRLIDQFGRSKDVRDGLVGSMHTFGWSGSLTTYYALYVEPLKELMDHPIDEVRLWATTQLGQLQRTIRNEHTRDDEEEAYWKA